MFKRFFKRKINTDAFTNLIAEGSTITGGMTFSGTLKVQGTIQGESGVHGASANDPQVDEDCLIVDKTGFVNAPSIKCADLVSAGTLEVQEIRCRGQIKLLKSTTIKDCTIYYNELEVELGATIHNCRLINMKMSDAASAE